ncbi:MAG: transcriptional repressor [Chloroflexi bacterium]|nr:transcriptional repressor [Chloroflexota bacterium]
MKKQYLALVEQLEAHGYRLTPQREIVLSILSETDKHVSAETLLLRVRQVYSRANKSVVYRNLDLLAQLGLISCVDLGQGRVEYEVHRHPHHHHLVCRHCKQVIEVSANAFAALQRELLERHGFAADMDHLAIFGLCRKCQSQQAAHSGHHPHAL